MPDPVDRTAPAAPPRATGAVASPDADLLLRLSERLTDEVESAQLPLLDGDTVQIVCVAEVQQWLQGCAVRLRAGESL